MTRSAPAFLALTLFCISPAYAWDCSVWHQSTNPSGECYQAPAGAAATSTASATQQQAQIQGQAQQQTATGGTASATASGGQGGSATAAGGSGGSADNAGNSQSSTYVSITPRQTPVAVSGYVEPSAECMAARNGGASSPVAAISFGFSKVDKGCELREDARMLYEMGQRAQAVELLCVEARKLGLKDCAYHVLVVAAVRRDPDAVTREELREVERRMVRRGVGK
jgi:hypothetical protein